MATICQERRVLVEIPAPQPKIAAHLRRSYLDVLNSRVGPSSYGGTSTVSPSPTLNGPTEPCPPSLSLSRTEHLQADQVSLSQHQLVDLIRTLILRRKEPEAVVICSDLKILQEDLHLKKASIYRSIPYSRFGSNRDAHCYRKAYPHLQAFKRSCQEGGRLLLQAQRWGAALEYALVAWRYVDVLPQWDTSSHNVLREQCYGVLAHMCSTVLRHYRPDAPQARDLLRRFKLARAHSNLILPCVEKLEEILEEMPSSPAHAASQGVSQH